jgi:hypothetical protein
MTTATQITAPEFSSKVAQTLGEAVLIEATDTELDIYRVETTDGIFVTICDGALFVEDYAEGKDWEEIQSADPWSVLKANINRIRNARKAN